MRGATQKALGVYEIFKFLSTLPMRGATAWQEIEYAADTFLSTLPMRGATANMMIFRSHLQQFVI